jgi:uncharacterized protein involved in exopolysaccharide biosynthesis
MAEPLDGRPAETRSEDWIDWPSLLGRRKWLMMSVVLATIATTYVTVRFVLTELYEAKASVLVKTGRENIEVPATVLKGTLTSGGVRREDLNSEIQMLRAPSLITAVVDRLGADAFQPPPRPSATGWQAVVEQIREAARWAVRASRRSSSRPDSRRSSRTGKRSSCVSSGR